MEMTASVAKTYGELVERLRRAALLRSCGSVLGWDEQTYLPPKGGEHRANQLALLAGMSHELGTDPRIGELLSQLEDATQLGGAGSAEAAVVREARHRYVRATCLPRKLVEEMSRVTTLSQQAWVKARKAKRFSDFLPWVSQVIQLKREEAAAVGSPSGNLYDALLDDYEPGATSEMVAGVFGPLKEELVSLVDAIRGSGVEADLSLISRRYPVSAQQEFALRAATAIGFDFEAGRLDIAAHPFCSGFGPGDCRLTTRYDEHHFPGAFFGTLHEAGHGMYEQGLPHEHFGTGLGEAASLGIHESQSRMWENLVGRSRPFWNHFYPAAQQTFPEALGGVELESFYRAINDVRPSWIRVEADEVTYNLHIMLRFELEQELISGR
ncbi:MAG: carboxypeptidase M32, partial [Planctomycetaceae bacterium]